MRGWKGRLEVGGSGCDTYLLLLPLIDAGGAGEYRGEGEGLIPVDVDGGAGEYLELVVAG